ncbi:MAG TPA: T9SS type A sorting domain-containing protein [Chitinophagaceae bacterium]|nr:T9SS type A sorting domain-containing protein [Chitinophagaceae bacterium]
MNNNTTEYLDATANPLTQYYYYVVAGNGNGESPSSDTISVLIGNNSPVITNLENLLVKTGASAIENFSVTDNAGDVLNVSSPNLPSFVTLQNLGGGNYRIVANPTKDNMGRFDITVNAADDKGGLTSQTFLLNVVDRNTRSFYIKVGTDGTFGGTPWNDVLGFPFDGKSQANLRDEAGVVSNITMTFRNSWSGTNPLGFITGNNSGVYPDSVLRSYVFATDNAGKRIKFTGLDPTKRYNVVFMGSANDGLTAVANYSAPGATTVSLNARYNSTQTAQLNRLAPVGDSIIVTATKQAASTLMYLNAIVLEEFTDTFNTTILFPPINLKADPRDKSTVFLSWADRSNHELNYEVQRATAPGGPWTTLPLLGQNVTTFTNSNLGPNTRYYFRVRAVNGVNGSEFTNVVSTITPKTQVFVNLDFTYPGPFPWNNLNANPNAGLSFQNFFSDQNLSTGIGLTITKEFNGQFDAGMQTFASGGIFPDNVMRSNYWTDQSQQAQFKISGLNQGKRYRFGFFGSTGPAWFDGNYTATYSIGNRTVYLNSHRNDSKVVYIGDVVPDVNGEVLLNVSTTNLADNGFTAALVINCYDDAVGGVVPNRIITTGSGVSSGTDQPPGQTLSNASRTAAQPIVGKINAYPNPFTDLVNIEFYNNAAGNRVMIDLYDMSGRLVYRRSPGHLPVGHNRLNLNVQNNGLTPGVYLLKLNVNGQTLSSTKLIKNRK